MASFRIVALLLARSLPLELAGRRMIIDKHIDLTDRSFLPLRERGEVDDTDTPAEGASSDVPLAPKAGDDVAEAQGPKGWVRTPWSGKKRHYDQGPKSAPVIWLPGITSMQLEYRIIDEALLPSYCRQGVKSSKAWSTLFFNPLASLNLACFLYAMKLQPPGKDGCVKDAPGLEIREVGFGVGRPTLAVNPTVHIYDEAITAFEEGAQLEAGSTLVFGAYDWRKAGDTCWEEKWHQRYKELIEETSRKCGSPVILGCHSMGCPVVHRFLSAANTTREWKRQYVQEFIATGAPFAGSAQILQNFIQGPSYEVMPLVASSIGRAAVNSWPAIYSLQPVDGMGSWPSDVAFVETPWKNYTIKSLADGTFWDDVEVVEEVAGSAQKEDLEQLEAARAKDANGTYPLEKNSSSVSGEDENDTSDGEWVLTEQGCVCETQCASTGIFGISTGVQVLLEHAGVDWIKHNAKPWCKTLGACGNKRMKIRSKSYRWDFCGGTGGPADAGPAFQFFPGVELKSSSWYTHLPLGLFGTSKAYLQVWGSQEEIKRACMDDSRCSGFSDKGWLHTGRIEPSKDWKGIMKIRTGVVQGTYVKRPSFLACQKKQPECGEIGVFITGSEVCGSNGETYATKCALATAKCLDSSVTLVSKGPCPSSYRTPKQCACSSECGLVHPEYLVAAARALRWGKSDDVHPPIGQLRTRWCVTKDNCGHQVGRMHWDHCGDEGGLTTFMGFTYHKQTKLKGYYILKQGQQPISMERLQEECFMDFDCGGFFANGTLLTHEISKHPEDWYNAWRPERGVYMKTKEYGDCQKRCDDVEKKPVCLVEEGHGTRVKARTFESSCLVENYLCNPRHMGTVHPGSCARQGNTGLHAFAREFQKRASSLGPPDVPTTCMYITDVETLYTFKYAPDFRAKGAITNSTEGDGTVNAESVEGPCLLWNTTQSAPVRLMPLQLGGVSHVTMLMSIPFWKEVLGAMAETGWQTRGPPEVENATADEAADAAADEAAPP